MRKFLEVPSGQAFRISEFCLGGSSAGVRKDEALEEKRCRVIRILLWHVSDWRVGGGLMLFLHHPPFAKFFQFVSALQTP